jgi:hypothetical protein
MSAEPCSGETASQKRGPRPGKRKTQQYHQQKRTDGTAPHRTLPEIAFTRNHISRPQARKRFIAWRYELLLLADFLKDYREQCEREDKEEAGPSRDDSLRSLCSVVLS